MTFMREMVIIDDEPLSSSAESSPEAGSTVSRRSDEDEDAEHDGIEISDGEAVDRCLLSNSMLAVL